ncbi:MAG: dockerin type I domain-containing protein [Planctomycetota bacterium]|nr:dockerin type I domain-containing protein [Planctomycetota bacterium]
MRTGTTRRMLSAAVMATGMLLAGSETAFGQANDLCANASPIGDGSTAYSTVGANTDGPAHGECEFDGQTYNDIWYEYQATCTGELTVSTCNQASYDTDLVVYNGCDCSNLDLLGCNDDGSGCAGFTSEVAVPVFQNNCYLVRVGGWNSGDEGTGTVTLTCLEEGEIIGACCLGGEECTIMTQAECGEAGGEEFHEGFLQCSPNPCAFGNGPDVTYSNVTSIAHYGPVDGIHAYILDSHTCNVGDQNLLWGYSHNGTPVLAMNAYRLLGGRLEQIGMSWVKHACCAAAGSGCGLPCNGTGGTLLGVGCRDVYGTGWNSIQSNLGARSNVNAFTGTMPSADGTTGDSIFKRLQINEHDLGQPGALYFVEGVYAATDDAQAGNAMNNATYRRALLSGFNLSLTGSTQVTIPAIFAWHDHGNGVNTPDASIQTVEVDVPDEGRFYAASRVQDNGDGTWRYTYAIYNLNSHRSASALSVPLGSNVTAVNVGFHDVDYHSGEPYSNTNWSGVVSTGSVTWTSPQTFEENPNTNALRWATMYTFWFDADTGPQDAQLTLSLFRPGTPESVTFTAPAPSPAKIPCPADFDGDGAVGASDLAQLLGAWGPNPGHPADFDGDGMVNAFDLAQLLGDWGPCS